MENHRVAGTNNKQIQQYIYYAQNLLKNKLANV